MIEQWEVTAVLAFVGTFQVRFTSFLSPRRLTLQHSTSANAQQVIV
jgi:hypothetical protein